MTEPELAAVLDVERGAQQRTVGVRRQEAARLAALHRPETHIPDAVLEQSRARSKHRLHRVAAARADLGDSGGRVAHLEVRVLVRAVALVPERPQHAELRTQTLLSWARPWLVRVFQTRRTLPSSATLLEGAERANSFTR